MLHIPLSSSTLYSLYFIVKCLLLMVVSSLFISCTSSTKPPTGAISGTVTLVNDTGDVSLDPSDYSGVTIALYNLAVLDTTVIRINQKYPNIGQPIGQESEFDHRQQVPLYVAETDEGGSFVIDQVPYGYYNIAYRKEGWGIRFIYNIEINKSEISLRENIGDKKAQESFLHSKDINNLILYPQTVLPNTITEEFIFKSNHTYIAENDVVAISNVTLQNSSLLLVGTGNRFDFYGSITTDDNGSPWRIDTLHGFLSNGTPDSSLEVKYERIGCFYPLSTTLTNGFISNCQDGLAITSQTATIRNMVFHSGNTAVYFTGDSLLLTGNTIHGFAGRTVVLNGNSDVNMCIFIGNHDNLIMSDNDFNVDNNYFGYNWVGIRPIHGSTVIHHNEFWGNTYAISTVASSPLIQYNNFLGSTRYCFQPQPNYIQDSYEYGDPRLMSNNFYTRNRVIISLKPDDHPGYFGSGNVGVVHDLEAKNNYWLTNNISDVLFDVNDDPSINYSIVYMPKLGTPVSSAGISL